MHPFEQHLHAHLPPHRWRDLTVLVAISGGADSVALLCGLAKLRAADASENGLDTPSAGEPQCGPSAAARPALAGSGRLIAAHFHHGLRGAEADADQQFVQELCASLGMECVIGRAGSASPGASTAVLTASEEASRDARYRFLLETAQLHGARYVVTAHTADDQAETVLHRILRGAGLVGIAGMRRARELADGIALVRPLLAARRADVRAYLADQRQSFREDSSNAQSVYTRNRLRNDLLPKLAAEYNPQIVDALLRLSSLAGEAQEVIAADAMQLLERSVLFRAAGQLTLSVAMLAAAPRHLARETLMIAWRNQGWPLAAMGHDEWTLLADIATAAPPRKRVFPGEVTADRSADTLTLSRKTTPL